VIGGGDPRAARQRWARRLEGLSHELRRRAQALQAEDEAGAARALQQQGDLAALQAFALPLLDQLLELPEEARWTDWLEGLSLLAARALREPQRVQALLAELQPLGPVGPVRLSDVRLLLSRRLLELPEATAARRQGSLLVGSIEEVRGLSFSVVFVPGLAERLFPQKVVADPFLPDPVRAALEVAGPAQRPAQDLRVLQEKLWLRLCVGAAEERLHASWPRLDLQQQARSRVPSFYALELCRAAEGELPAFSVLARRADQQGAAKASWPAPPRAEQAIDAAEYDLALLEESLQLPPQETRGILRYLVEVHPALGRALRNRARRWFRGRWLPSDGLVDPGPAAREALRPHQPEARSFSATALQQYAACPYRFLLHTVHRIAPREEPRAIEELDPISRGSLTHEVQFELLARLDREGLLPLHLPDPAARAGRLALAQQRLAAALAERARGWKDLLAPAVERKWDDAVASIDADLREWLQRLSQDPRWSPFRYELSFGIPDRKEHDPHSRPEPVALANGLLLRGSIDLVEQGEQEGALALRATDHKTGRVRAREGALIGGGQLLQPALYALALEQLFPGQRVESGRLWYCTHRGGFAEVVVPLDQRTREAAALLSRTVGDALAAGFFPAAPAAGECERCDYLDVCGPGEEERAARKPAVGLVPLTRLRSEP
jgi:hypothetical protein